MKIYSIWILSILFFSYAQADDKCAAYADHLSAVQESREAGVSLIEVKRLAIDTSIEDKYFKLYEAIYAGKAGNTHEEVYDFTYKLCSKILVKM